MLHGRLEHAALHLDPRRGRAHRRSTAPPRPPWRRCSRCRSARSPLRHRNRLTVLIERLAYLPMALPGLVIALGLVSFSVRYAFALYQSSTRADRRLRDPVPAAGRRRRALGDGAGLAPPGGGRPLARSRPDGGLAPGHAAADRAGPGRGVRARLHLGSTELTATLLLRPTGVNTLATQFWAYTTNFSYGAAAPYAALMVAISAVPAYLLSRRMRTISRMARADAMSQLSRQGTVEGLRRAAGAARASTWTSSPGP